MYGLIGKMTAAPGKRDELVSILLEGVATMPGCLSYIIAKDTGRSRMVGHSQKGDRARKVGAETNRRALLHDRRSSERAVARAPLPHRPSRCSRIRSR